MLVGGFALIGSGCTDGCSSPPPAPIVASAPAPAANPLRIGIQLHNAPGMLLYQGQLTGTYSQMGTNVQFLTTANPRNPRFSELPEEQAVFDFLKDSLKDTAKFGRPTVHTLYKGLASADLDCAASSGVGFVRALSTGGAKQQAVTAVMTLGQASTRHPAAALMVRKGLDLSKAKTWDGLRIARFNTNNLGNALVDELCVQAGGDLEKVSYTKVKSIKGIRQALKADEVDLAIIAPNRLERIFLKTGRFRKAEDELASVASPEMFQQVLVCSDLVIEERSDDIVDFLTTFSQFVKRHSETDAPPGAQANSDNDRTPTRRIDGKRFPQQRRGKSTDHKAASLIDLPSLKAIKRVLTSRVTFEDDFSMASHVNTALLERALAADLPAGEVPAPSGAQ